MITKKLSRRDFLRISALATAGIALAGCGGSPTEEPEPEVEEPEPEVEAPEPTTAPAEPETVLLEIGATQPEYINAEEQMWDVYMAENPNVTVELFAVNEDQQAAFQAKVAGGHIPAFFPSWHLNQGINKDNYEQFLDLSTIDFPWWDRFTHDPLNNVPKLYGYGPRVIQMFTGFIFTWQYHKDLMEEAGLNPRENVKTWDDMKTWLQAGTDWANENDDVDFFWDQAWHNWVFGYNYMRTLPLAFSDGQQENIMACYCGDMAFNDADSPYRHTLEFFKEAYDKGWIPENFWTREWETDMESSYMAKKSVMMLHGPWPWDKMLAADPSAQQEGIPASPPASDQATWMQYQSEPDYVKGQACMLTGVTGLSEWPEIEKAFAWYHSPEVMVMRSEIHGRVPLYELDEALELSGPQWTGIVKEFQPGGFYEDVQVTSDLWGSQWASPDLVGGAQGVFDYESGALTEQFRELVTGGKSVQEVLDVFQNNYEESYDLDALKGRA